MQKPTKVVIAPEALEFLESQMTPEELQEFLDNVKEGFLNGDLLEQSEPVDLDRMQEEEPEVYAQIMAALQNMDGPKKH